MRPKDDELRYIESFQRARPDFALRALTPGERPDFMARLENQILGIELTRFSPVHSGGPRAEEQQNLQRRTMELARAEYARRGGIPLQVNASFSLDQPLSKRRVPHLAEEIAVFLLPQTHALVIYEQRDFDRLLDNEHLPEVAALSAFRVPSEEHGVWYAGEGAWVRHANHSDVSRIVATKESRVLAYRSRCDQLWLLIVFELLSGSTHVEIPIVPIEFSVRSAFDRVFCLAPVGDRCVEVPVTSVPAAQ